MNVSTTRATANPAQLASLNDAGTLRRVITASSLGTLFEWYDFYLYGSLAVFFGGLFFPSGNETAQLLASLATFGAGFGVRPLGAYSPYKSFSLIAEPYLIFTRHKLDPQGAASHDADRMGYGLQFGGLYTF
jgi:hypothetical protein